MRGTALLQSVSWFQLSLALHAALGFALYAVAPQWEHVAAWDAHHYQVTLAPEELDDFSTDESGAVADEEESLCIERDAPEEDPAVYDGPPQEPIPQAGFAFELSHDIAEVEPGEWAHKHVMVKYGFAGKCKHCKKPTSYRTRCTIAGCTALGGGGHRCVVARCGSGRPAKRKAARAPATK